MVIGGDLWVTEMFTGEFRHSLDAKGRVIVPSSFRELLGPAFHICKGFDGCIAVYPEDAWQDFSGKLNALPKISRDARKLSRFFLSGAVSCEADRQGRILLPGPLREYAGITKEAVLIGNGDHVEIWDVDRWADEVMDDMNADEIAAGLSTLGINL